MDMLVKKLRAGQTVRARPGQYFLHVGGQNAPARPVGTDVAYDFINAAVRPESQRVLVTRQFELLPGLRVLTQCQTTSGPAKVKFGKRLILPRGLLEIGFGLRPSARLLRRNAF